MATKKSVHVEPTSQALTPIEPKYLSDNTINQLVDMPTKALALTAITTDDQLVAAGLIDGMCAETIKGITKELKPGKDKAHEAWKWFTTYEAEKTAPLVKARQHISALVSACLVERERVAVELANKQRLELAEQARLAAEQDKQTRMKVLVAEGQVEAAAELMVEDLVVDNTARVNVVVSRPVGFSMHATSRWSAEVVDLRVLMQAVLDGKLPLGTTDNPGPVMANQKYLDKLATLDKSTLMIPGVKPVETKGTSR